MPTNPDPLELPAAEQREYGWELANGSVETLFELPGIRVRGTTRRYEDERTRTALSEALDSAFDRTLRFFATTRLGFEPPLPPGVGPAMVLPTLRSEAQRNFADRLRERGLTGVQRRGREQFRSGDRTRVGLTRYAATDPLPERAGELPLECWLGVWVGGSVNVVTAGYPTVDLASRFGLDATPVLSRSVDEFRREFRALVRSLA